MTQTQKETIVAIIGQDTIPFITEGIASEVAGYIVPEAGMESLAAALEASSQNREAAEALAGQVSSLQQDLAAAYEERDAAETALNTANEQVASLQARVAELESEPPISQTNKGADGGGKPKTPAHEDAKASFNALADRLMGTPKPKTSEE